MKERNNKVRDEMEMKRRKLIEKEKRGGKRETMGRRKEQRMGDGGKGKERM
jgi:hypothetical protein